MTSKSLSIVLLEDFAVIFVKSNCLVPAQPATLSDKLTAHRTTYGDITVIGNQSDFV